MPLIFITVGLGLPLWAFRVSLFWIHNFCACSMKQLAFLFVFICYFWSLGAQVTLRLTSIPANTPAGSSIYFAASINNWNPGDAASALTVVNGVYQLVIPEGTGTVSFKFTRGDWASVEANASGQDIPNRTFTFTGSPQVINLSVLRWKDNFGGGVDDDNVRPK